MNAELEAKRQMGIKLMQKVGKTAEKKAKRCPALYSVKKMKNGPKYELVPFTGINEQDCLPEWQKRAAEQRWFSLKRKVEGRIIFFSILAK